MLAVDKVMARPHGFDQKELRSFCFWAGSVGSPRCVPTPRTPRKVVLEHSISFKNWEQQPQSVGAMDSPTRRSLYDHMASTPKSELDAAAVKLQKTYKSYRTRRNMADCAVVTEELWWKEQTEQSISITWSNLLDTTLLELRSIHFFNEKKNETAVSRWARAKRRLAKVGKGLSKDEKAQQLALQHWLEAIDPRHRYGHNLHIYYEVWLKSESIEPFFYWLDVGAGKEVNLENCQRSKLLKQCIKYLGTEERKAYEVVVKAGRLVYKQTDLLVETDESSKWIFVLSTTRNLYIGKKQKGTFQHSSFLSGAATSAAGRLVAKDGVLKAMWPYSGHYLPTEENFKVFISFLLDNAVDLTDVKKCSVDDDPYPTYKNSESTEVAVELPAMDAIEPDNGSSIRTPVKEFQKRSPYEWSNGTAARISCVNNYSADIQAKALGHVKLSPRVSPSPVAKFPIPSPRPSPRQLVSPSLSVIGIPSPRAIPLSCTPRRR